MNLAYGIPFHCKTINECRAVGRIGGLHSARNRRLRRLAEAPLLVTAAPELPQETACEAIMRLDEQFPWLIGAEQRAKPSERRELPQSLRPRTGQACPSEATDGQASNLGCSRRMPWNKTL